MEKSKWQYLKIEFKARLNDPLKHPEFIFYFIAVIFLMGIMGVVVTFWVENNLTKTNPNHKFSNIHVILSVTAYFVALLTSSAVDLILSPKSNTLDNQSILRRSLIMIGVGSILIGLVIMALALTTAEYCIWGYLFATIGLVFSWYIWWIANSANPNLTDTSENALTVIGNPASNPNTNSLQLPGNLTGIQL